MDIGGARGGHLGQHARRAPLHPASQATASSAAAPRSKHLARRMMACAGRGRGWRRGYAWGVWGGEGGRGCEAERHMEQQARSTAKFALVTLQPCSACLSRPNRAPRRQQHTAHATSAVVPNERCMRHSRSLRHHLAGTQSAPPQPRSVPQPPRRACRTCSAEGASAAMRPRSARPILSTLHAPLPAALPPPRPATVAHDERGRCM